VSSKLSAGILLYRRRGSEIEVLLGHPGGPFWAKKDAGAWSIPKGEIEDNEDLIEAAKREFSEELGHAAPKGPYVELGSWKRKDGKQIYIWATEGDFDVSHITSNTVTIEWPPKSGKNLEFPEIDRAAWISLTDAPMKLHKGQDVFMERLAGQLQIELPLVPEQQSLL
jgi:predicted NUDIX family NTP pyrophosphohydrolase